MKMIISLLMACGTIADFGSACAEITLDISGPRYAAFGPEGYMRAPLLIEASREGKPVKNGLIRLEIAGAENRSAAIADPVGAGKAGLSWNRPAPAGRDAITETEISTDGNGKAEAILTDILGERDAVVRISCSSDGETAEKVQRIAFGAGPLAVFVRPPEKKPLSWLELYEKCNGEPYGGDPAEWNLGEGFKGGAGMPSLDQLQAVSMPGQYNRRQSAMGAAIAAGWPTDKRYWNGRAVMKSRASHVDLRDGNFHGSGGNDVKGHEYGVCLK